jgi:transposase
VLQWVLAQKLVQENRPSVSHWEVKAKQFSQNELLPDSGTLTLRSAVRTETGWEVEAVGSDRAACPDCGEVSHSRHSRYWRRLRDLPVQGITVNVRLQLGRWRCRSGECRRGIFVERITGVAAPHARQLSRLGEVRVLIGRAMGGRPGERLMSRLGMSTGRQTILRQVTAARTAGDLR